MRPSWTAWCAPRWSWLRLKVSLPLACPLLPDTMGSMQFLARTFMLCDLQALHWVIFLYLQSVGICPAALSWSILHWGDGIIILSTALLKMCDFEANGSITWGRIAGEYLKTKRSLIRAQEKLASLSEEVEQLKQALSKAGVNNNADSPSARSDTSTQPFGTPKSVQASTPTSHL